MYNIYPLIMHATMSSIQNRLPGYRNMTGMLNRAIDAALARDKW